MLRSGVNIHRQNRAMHTIQRITSRMKKELPAYQLVTHPTIPKHIDEIHIENTGTTISCVVDNSNHGILCVEEKEESRVILDNLKNIFPQTLLIRANDMTSNAYQQTLLEYERKQDVRNLLIYFEERQCLRRVPIENREHFKSILQKLATTVKTEN